ncbi:ABC transporter ATP-binding protein [Paractinoplanes brasiliensis]|uniref:ABC-2 type transport system ATP-binding protein n=1 Tax=Paractinoplanes brasiliensis TaxID=52695 RepID=A0A4V3C823_9ACTN|nr:ABC transporter ATP-binding protein [Actinoplanes brasiliensis]TDO39238.1 ABC-2 type transport system ATP-binding protein [Actinoplanes brasiliensis]GID30060.1 multidrug ABC transporter ATP-binding protein [Actinoplanes brasiliensis]
MTLARAVDVTRRYGDKLALDGVSFSVEPGELVGLLGPNGAGKSTLVNLLTGIRRPTSGTVELFGGDPRLPHNRRHLGVTPQETGLPSSLRVGEVVDFVSAHYERPLPKAELLDRFGLSELVRRQTGGLSGGEKRRVAVALAFAGRPRIVFLDEPTTGLDVQARRFLWDGIRSFQADGGTVVLTSHYLEEIEALARRVVVIGGGRVLADDTVDAVRGLVAVRRVSLSLSNALPESLSNALPGRLSDALPEHPSGVLPDLAGVASVERDGDRLHLLTADADRLVRDLVAYEVPFTDLEVRPTSLEEAFLTITRDSVPAAA